jgi:hypothetical protein
MASAMYPTFDADGCTPGRERVPRRYVVSDRDGRLLCWCPDREAAESVRSFFDREAPGFAPHSIRPE